MVKGDSTLITLPIFAWELVPLYLILSLITPLTRAWVHVPSPQELPTTVSTHALRELGLTISQDSVFLSAEVHLQTNMLITILADVCFTVLRIWIPTLITFPSHVFRDAQMLMPVLDGPTWLLLMIPLKLVWPTAQPILGLMPRTVLSRVSSGVRTTPLERTPLDNVLKIVPSGALLLITPLLSVSQPVLRIPLLRIHPCVVWLSVLRALMPTIQPGDV